MVLTYEAQPLAMILLPLLPVLPFAQTQIAPFVDGRFMSQRLFDYMFR